jgi:hypothetical protein
MFKGIKTCVKLEVLMAVTMKTIVYSDGTPFPTFSKNLLLS